MIYEMQAQDYISETDSEAETDIGPFLGVPVTPDCHASRAWHCASPENQNFLIFEDPQEEGSPFVLCPLPYFDGDEEKENTFATVSDYDSQEERDPPGDAVDWTHLEARPLDAFGLPVETMLHPPPLVTAQLDSDTDPMTTPRVTDTPIRPAMRVILRDEDEPEEEWDDSLSNAQTRELQELSDVYHRGAENRRHHDHHLPLRDGHIQGQANIFLEVRRVTHFQRHENRHRRVVAVHDHWDEF
ncbi:uncharacterized protein N7482_007219 [Penicillium canariense]|uniref:Uncharacterized protein n=1 Tax=Penicillium canariense TaxID=189055 RepID=A0A9W9HZ45_9EURO|nr:uncharacterized protein N7482_007219 [Penicillium canariense]KAJ5160215.1 hypothetical protein N7482_007219 [Penicillium canariense]